MLGEVLEEKDVVLTKIPAKIKPKEEVKKFDSYYEYSYILTCVKKSLKNLKRKKINVLFHNWHVKWNDESLALKYLKELKSEKFIEKIGISLPNNYNSSLPVEILKVIDIIEISYNSENNWVLNDINRYKFNNIEIILRSLFIQGKELIRETDYKLILNNVKNLSTSLAIGMTTKSQIDKNIEILR